MTTRIIRIETCATCQNRDHAGAFGEVAEVPMCRATKPSSELPHTVERGFANRLQAVATDEIPDWCPLEKLP